MIKNIFKDFPKELNDEFMEDLLNTKDFRVERIVSRGHSTPRDTWYDQAQNEFVLLLQGKARLEYEDGNIQEMVPGDWLVIPSHVKHRVDWTSPGEETFWLTIFY